MVGLDSEAFVFLNHYLDLCEAIEENNSDLLDHNDFMATDFPDDIPLPATQNISNDLHEEVKEWVLSVSMDQKIDQVTICFMSHLVYILQFKYLLTDTCSIIYILISLKLKIYVTFSGCAY